MSTVYHCNLCGDTGEVIIMDHTGENEYEFDCPQCTAPSAFIQTREGPMPMKNLICIYHKDCTDGFAAAMVVHLRYNGSPVEFVAAQYGDEPPDVEGRQVLIVDFSYKRDVLDRMAESAQSILILDHHKSAKEDLAGLPAPPYPNWLPDGGVYALFDMKRSGAMITWDYFNPTHRAPWLIEHVQDRDLWQFKYEGTREVHAALRNMPMAFKEWEPFMNDDNVPQLIEQGAVLVAKFDRDVRDLVRGNARRGVIAGYDVPVLNAPGMYASDACHLMDQGELFAACYWDKPDVRVYSLRSSPDGLDVSKIAAQFGGGGHKHAAGFTVPVQSINVAPEGE